MATRILAPDAPPSSDSDPTLDQALGAAAPAIVRAVREAHAAYARLGTRHALVGDLAMILHGQPRDEPSVAFLVGHEAFERRGSVVSFRAGVPLAVDDVAVDSIVAPPPYRAVLDQALDRASLVGGVPVVAAEYLVFMKLVSTSRSDLADVEALVRAGRVDVERARRLFGADSLAAAALDGIVADLAIDA